MRDAISFDVRSSTERNRHRSNSRSRRRLLSFGFATLGLCSANISFAEVNDQVNPAGFAYSSVSDVGAFSAPTALLVTGRCNRDDPAFSNARDSGAEVLAYLNVVDIPPSDHTNCSNSDIEKHFYMDGVANVPKWGLDSSGQWRVNYRQSNGTANPMANIRVNSAWSDYVVKYIEQMMVENKVDGVFLDVLGARLWSTYKDVDTNGDGVKEHLPLARWDNNRADGTPEWPQSEKDAFASGAVDLVQRLNEARIHLNPDFIILNNNVWDDHGRSLGLAGEQYVNGVMMESLTKAPSDDAYHVAYAKKPFRGDRRRVIARYKADTAAGIQIAKEWAAVEGVTHATAQVGYSTAGSPLVTFNALNDRKHLHTEGNTAEDATNTRLLSYGTKRASRFTFSKGGRVERMGAYVDGQGQGTNGSMLVRMVLYTDGVDSSTGTRRPNTVVVASQDVTVNFGQSPGWVDFPLPSTVTIPAGNYWIAIHGGPPGGRGREYADSSTNCLQKNDAFEDGSSNWGSSAGTSCTGTTRAYVMIAD